MSLNIFLQPTGEAESVPIILNSVTIDNPTDIAETDERLFTNTYTFTMKLNYYMPKKNLGLITNVSSRVVDQTEVLQLDKAYIENLDKITSSFSQYVNNSGLSNPFITG
jgi:hypothetical protein